MSEERVHQFADQLRQYATHFAMRDWNYSRDLGSLEEIRYETHRRDRLPRRLTRALRHLFPRRLDGLYLAIGPRGLRKRLIYACVAFRRDRNLPDGILDNGNIITHWEETGEYLQYVQPSVGEMLADWMDAEPESEHAQRIADEMKRINDAYGARLAAEVGDSDD